MNLAFAIVASLQQAAVTRADCKFGSNYTTSFNRSSYCSFEVAVGRITLSSTSNTISSGDTNVTTTTNHRDYAIWKVGDKESTVQCYPNITADVIETAYPNGSTYVEATGDFYLGLGSTNDTIADGVPLSIPGLYYFKEGRYEYWSDKDDNWNITDAEGDITDLCEVLGGGGAPAPTPTSPTTEAPAPASDSSVGDSTVGTITEDSDGNIVGSYGEGAYGTVDIEHSTETFYNGGKVATLARTTTAALLVGAAAFATM